jgi:hypothetical protein
MKKIHSWTESSTRNLINLETPTFGMTGRKNNEEEETGCMKKAKRKLED